MWEYIVAAFGAIGLLLRWEVGTFPYSGQGISPKFGDYEAHRHWMEVTLNLPLREWYLNTSRNDLGYWGLDYPPLSAYHSFGLGKIFETFLPESIALHSSRGFESPTHKFLMRATVTISDILLPALLIYHFVVKPKALKTSWGIVFLSVAAPPLIIIDYAHFQYNCVSLGLTVWAIMAVISGNITVGAILYTLAVNHKQMSLYHSVSFFCYLVGTVVFKRRSWGTAFRVAICIVSTLVLLWMPFGNRVPNVLNRVFPIKRGVFEDIVGTFWYVLDRFIRVRGIPDATLARTCGIVTFSMLLPSAIHLLTTASSSKKSKEEIDRTFLVNLFTSSLIFFMFSYHVHEKSILLAVLPAVLLLQWYPFEMTWFILAASFSLFPLMRQEGSHLALVFLITVFFIGAVRSGIFKNLKPFKHWFPFVVSMGGYVALSAGMCFTIPPKNLPYLFQAGFALFSFAHYSLFLLVFHMV